MATGEKRISELTQIVSAPSNGVLPIDVPGSEETNGITIDNLARTMPVATSEKNGMMESSKVMLLNSMSITYGISGGSPPEFIRLGRFRIDHYLPIRITLSYGSWNSTARTNIDVTITNGYGQVVFSGKGYGVIGYVAESGDIFFKCAAGMSFVGIIVGSFIKGREITKIEPEGIVYVE